MTKPILSTRNLTRDFGPFRAVDGVSLDIRRGSITGLIGPNGAGKSTLFNVLTGMLAPTAGQVTLEGRDVTGQSPGQAIRPRPWPHLPDPAALRADERSGKRDAGAHEPGGRAPLGPDPATRPDADRRSRRSANARSRFWNS